MAHRWILGAGFQHLVYWKGDLNNATDVHLYLEGDGLPWRSRFRVADDPTPKNPLALRLMGQDSAASVYIGRPCYYGGTQGAVCQARIWTSDRYSEDVVRSMAQAALRVLPPASRTRVTLVGYSGGGALAALLAPRLPQVDRIITIAANLDIDAWADVHAYSRLTGSLNPADQPALDARIQQLHLVGENDDEVPLTSIQRFLTNNPRAVVRVLPGFDHRCCWLSAWPELSQ